MHIYSIIIKKACNSNKKRMRLISLLLAMVSWQIASGAERNGLIAGQQVTVIDRTSISTEAKDPVAFGKRELYEAIRVAGGSLELLQYRTQTDRKIYLLIGQADNRVIGRLLGDELYPSLSDPEGVIYQWRKTNDGLALVVSGTDKPGLMYALTELAQRIQDKGLEALTEVENTLQFPDNKIRGLDRFLAESNDDPWFFSEDYWQYYIGQLARNRFNRLTLITGYSSGLTEGFMVPIYPYLVKVRGYENLKLPDKIQKTPEQYLAQLRNIAKISHEHGLEFVLGIWNHGIPKNLESELPKDVQEYTKYCREGMRILLRQVPEIDGINLRINYEAGVGGFGETADDFWKEIISAIGEVHQERNGGLFLDLRAKGLTAQLRQWALETGMDLHVPTKYTWEATGLPYHPTQMRQGELKMLDNLDKRQRYGYADFMLEPRDYDVIFRLWAIGTNRLFTWGDPEYARRFSQSASFGGSRGFQVTPPLSMKINTWKLFEDKTLIHYTWEDQRYWAWYMLFGRLGYSSETDPDVWKREFRAHYGTAAEDMLAAYQAAGMVLPLVTSAHLTKHPAESNWAEMETGGALFGAHNASPRHNELTTYQSVEPGDPGLFYRIPDYVEDVLEGTIEGKYTPVQVAALYERMAGEIHMALDRAEASGVSSIHQAEYRANRLDLLVTADLAEFHSLKTRAATDLVFYQHTGESAYLRASCKAMREAAKRWKTMVGRTEKAYHSHPLYKVDLGTWADRIEEVELDVAELEKMLSGNMKGPSISHWDGLKVQATQLRMQGAVVDVPASTKANVPLKVSLNPGKEALLRHRDVILHYRHANMTEGPFTTVLMQWEGEACFAEVPPDYMTPEYDLLLYFTTIDPYGQTLMHPGLFHPDHPAPYYIIEIS